jgi:hypothetical protein
LKGFTEQKVTVVRQLENCEMIAWHKLCVKPIGATEYGGDRLFDVFKNKCRAVSQGTRPFGARSARREPAFSAADHGRRQGAGRRDRAAY